MTISEVKGKYTHNELFSPDSNVELRNSIFTSLFENLFENKIVIHDRFTCIATIKHVEILPDLFSAFIIPETFIYTETPSDKRQEIVFERMKQGWEISCKWEYMSIIGNSLCSSAYANWLLWIDPQTVELAEKLTKNGQSSEALKLTLYENPACEDL